MVHDDYLEDDEKVRLLKVVKYLEPTMAKELLCKFPDNSAFDFDYTQSSIWSPVAHHAFRSLPHLEIERVLDFQLNEIRGNKKMMKTTKHKKQLFRTLKHFSQNHFNLNLIYKTKMTSVPSAVSIMPKGWEGVLKAASKHFKRRKRKDQIVHVKASHQERDPLLPSRS